MGLLTTVVRSPTVERGVAALTRRLAVDTRALAAFRAALAVTLLVDLVHRSVDLVAFYTDRGVLPRSALAEQYPVASTVSVHALSGATWFQAALFVLAAVVALALLLGVRSRLAAAVSLYLLVSLQARNPLVLNAGDVVLSVLLALGLLVPLGERWSIDALGRSGRDRRVASVASATILLQVVAVYATNALLKLRGDRWLAGDALRYVFRLDQFTILLGDVLAGFPALARVLSYLWLALLAGSPLLLLLTGRARTALVALFAGAHLGMFLTVTVGLFPLALTAGVLLFLPAGAWDAVERRAAPFYRVFGLDWWAAALNVARSHVTVPSGPPALARWRRRLAPVLAAVVLVSLLAWNVGSLGYADPLSPVDDAETEDFKWGMFAEPPNSYRWYAVTVELESSREVDAFQRSVAAWDDPPDVARTYPNFRWRKFMSHVHGTGSEDDRLAAYACRRASAHNDGDAERVTITYYERFVYDSSPTIETQLLRYEC